MQTTLSLNFNYTLPPLAGIVPLTPCSTSRACFNAANLTMIMSRDFHHDSHAHTTAHASVRGLMSELPPNAQDTRSPSDSLGATFAQTSLVFFSPFGANVCDLPWASISAFFPVQYTPRSSISPDPRSNIRQYNKGYASVMGSKVWIGKCIRSPIHSVSSARQGPPRSREKHLEDLYLGRLFGMDSVSRCFFHDDTLSKHACGGRLQRCKMR